MTMRKRISSGDRNFFLDGQCLVAMPGLEDNRFSRAVILICAHSREGAMGIVVNHPTRRRMQFSDLLVQLNVIEPESRGCLLPYAESIPVLAGGPVDTERGFVLHSSDYYADQTTLEIDNAISLTASLDIMRAIARNEGPRQALMALGYAGWSAGQLEMEMQANAWLSCTLDPALLFDQTLDTKYERALSTLGIDPAFLSAQAGHA